MARQTFEAITPSLLAHEGGYTDDRHDPGNWTGGKVGVGRLVGTNHGIAAPTLAAHRKRSVTQADMRALTRDEAIRIYKAQYWDSVRADDLPAGVDYAVYDYSVNSGPGRAAKDLQRVLGVKVDSVIGPMTVDAALNSGLAPAEIVNRLCDRRLAFMKSLKTWGRYGRGWSRRVEEVRAKSLRLAAILQDDQRPEPASVSIETDIVPVPRAKPEDVSSLGAWKTPEGIAGGVGALTTLLSAISDSPILQYGAVAVFVVAAGFAGWYFVRRVKAEAS